MLNSNRLIRKVAACSVAVAIGLSALLLQGCGVSKQARQDFVDGYLLVMEQLQSKPEVAQEGRNNSMAYASSGYTDLASAEKAQQSYEVSSANDKAAQQQLSKLDKPDDGTKKMASALDSGISKVDEGNVMFAKGLAEAPGQTVEQRAATAQDIGPAMSAYVKGMTEIVGSLESLQNYIKDNSLEGGAQAKKWYEQINGELQMVKQYVQK